MKKDTKPVIHYRRKHYIISFGIALVLWIATGYMIYAVSPASGWIVLLLFGSVGGALFFTLSLLLHNSRQGMLIVTTVLSYAFLRLLHQDTPLNVLLLLGVVVTTEVYFRQKK